MAELESEDAPGTGDEGGVPAEPGPGEASVSHLLHGTVDADAPRILHLPVQDWHEAAGLHLSARTLQPPPDFHHGQGAPISQKQVEEQEQELEQEVLLEGAPRTGDDRHPHTDPEPRVVDESVAPQPAPTEHQIIHEKHEVHRQKQVAKLAAEGGLAHEGDEDAVDSTAYPAHLRVRLAAGGTVASLAGRAFSFGMVHIEWSPLSHGSSLDLPLD